MTASPGAPVPLPPKLVSTASILVLAAAAVNVIAGLLSLLQIDRVRQGVAASAQQGTNPASLQGIVVTVFAVIVGASVLYAAALVLIALALRRGRAGVRPVLVAASFLAVLGFLVSNEAAFAVVLLLAIADVMLYQRPVSEWARAVRARRG